MINIVFCSLNLTVNSVLNYSIIHGCTLARVSQWRMKPETFDDLGKKSSASLLRARHCSERLVVRRYSKVNLTQ